MWLRPNTRMVTESYNSIHCKMRSKLHKYLEHWEALFLWSWLNLWRWRTPLFKVSCHDQRQPSVSHHKQVSSIFFPFLFLKTPFTFLSQTPLLLSSHHRRMSLLGWQIKQILQLIVEIASVCDSCCAFYILTDYVKVNSQNFEGWKQVICERNPILAVICMCLWFESWLSFSSVNFLIYCSVGEKFKKVVVRFLRTNILKNMASSGENLVNLKKVFHSKYIHKAN